MFKQLTFRSDGAFWPLLEKAEGSGAEGAHGALATILAAPRRLAAAFVAEVKTRRAMQSLANLDDRMLRDIGIERSEIASACRLGRKTLQPSSDLRADITRWL
jgi:uncharacterized protein YjiS (DUF1127 family)